MTAKGSEQITLLTTVDPISSSTAVSSAWVSVAEVARILAVIQTGLIAATGTLNAKLEQATSGAGAGAKDVTGKAITQLPDTGDNKQALINCRVEELDIAGGFSFVRLTITPAVAAALIAGAVYGFEARYQPKAHAASVVETVG